MFEISRFSFGWPSSWARTALISAFAVAVARSTISAGASVRNKVAGTRAGASDTSRSLFTIPPPRSLPHTLPPHPPPVHAKLTVNIHDHWRAPRRNPREHRPRRRRLPRLDRRPHRRLRQDR